MAGVVIPVSPVRLDGAMPLPDHPDLVFFWFSPRQLQMRDLQNIQRSDPVAMFQLRLLQLLLEHMQHVKQGGAHFAQDGARQMGFVAHADVPCGAEGELVTHGQLFCVAFNHTQTLRNKRAMEALHPADGEDNHGDPWAEEAARAGGGGRGGFGGRGRGRGRGRPAFLAQETMAQCTNFGDLLRWCHKRVNSAALSGHGRGRVGAANDQEWRRVSSLAFVQMCNDIDPAEDGPRHLCDDRIFTEAYQSDDRNTFALLRLLSLDLTLRRMARSHAHAPWTSAPFYTRNGVWSFRSELQLRLVNVDAIGSPVDAERWRSPRGYHPDHAKRRALLEQSHGDAEAYAELVRELVSSRRVESAPPFKSMEELREYMYMAIAEQETTLLDNVAAGVHDGEPEWQALRSDRERRAYVRSVLAALSRKLVESELVVYLEQFFNSGTPFENLELLYTELQRDSENRVTEPQSARTLNLTQCNGPLYYNVQSRAYTHIINAMQALEMLGAIHLHALAFSLWQRTLTMGLLQSLLNHSIVHGPPSAGKSATTSLVVKLISKFLVQVIKYDTARSRMAEKQREYVVEVRHEMPMVAFGGKGDPTQHEFMKASLDGEGQRSAAVRDEETGQVVQVLTDLPRHQVQIALSNAAMDELSEAMMTRVEACGVTASERALPKNPQANRSMPPDGSIVELQHSLRLTHARDLLAVTMWSGLMRSGLTTERLFQLCCSELPHVELVSQFRSMQRIWNLTVVTAAQRVTSCLFDFPWSPFYNRPLSFDELFRVLQRCLFPLPQDLVFAATSRQDDYGSAAHTLELFRTINDVFFQGEAQRQAEGVEGAPSTRASLEPFFLVTHSERARSVVLHRHRVVAPIPGAAYVAPLSKRAYEHEQKRQDIERHFPRPRPQADAATRRAVYEGHITRIAEKLAAGGMEKHGVIAIREMVRTALNTHTVTTDGYGRQTAVPHLQLLDGNLVVFVDALLQTATPEEEGESDRAAPAAAAAAAEPPSTPEAGRKNLHPTSFTSVLFRHLAHRAARPEEVYLTGRVDPAWPMIFQQRRVRRNPRHELVLPALVPRSAGDEALLQARGRAVPRPDYLRRINLACERIIVQRPLDELALSEHCALLGLADDDFFVAGVDLRMVVDDARWRAAEADYFAAHPRARPEQRYPEDWVKMLAQTEPKRFVPVLQQSEEWRSLAEAVERMGEDVPFEPEEMRQMLRARGDPDDAPPALQPMEEAEAGGAEADEHQPSRGTIPMKEPLGRVFQRSRPQTPPIGRETSIDHWESPGAPSQRAAKRPRESNVRVPGTPPPSAASADDRIASFFQGWSQS